MSVIIPQSMFPILTLTGTPHARGFAHGLHAATHVRHSIASYARLFAYYRGLPWSSMQELAMMYVPVLETYAADALSEMYGIAAGARVAFPEILTLNVRTELLAGRFGQGRHHDYVTSMRENRAAGVPQHPDEGSTLPPAREPDMAECTTVASQPARNVQQHTWLAQNWDWTGDQRAACVVMRISEAGKPDILTLSEGGMLAKIGLNRAGIGVSLNILASKEDGKQPGMPVHVQLRQMLECDTFEAARASVERTPSGASSCITLADATGRLLALEVTPKGVGEIQPENGVLVHANHCISDRTQPDAAPLPKTSTTLQRHARAQVMIADAGDAGLDALITILRDKTGAPQCICRHPNLELHPCERTESVAGVAMNLTERVMHLAPDVPSDVTFTPIAL
jgi:isopenicillin-N N-acyltransferase-like protein